MNTLALILMINTTHAQPVPQHTITQMLDTQMQAAVEDVQHEIKRSISTELNLHQLIISQ